MEEIRENPHYLPGVRLPETIRIAYSMEEALEGAEIALLLYRLKVSGVYFLLLLLT